MFVEQHGEFEQVEFTAFEWEEVYRDCFILKLFLHAAAAFLQQSRPARTREVQTCMLHVHDIAG